MKSNEIRIGNDTNLGYVYLIEDNNFYVMDDEGVSYKNTWADIKPIQLTEEWLIKFGFNEPYENMDKDFIFHKKVGEYFFTIYYLQRECIFEFPTITFEDVQLKYVNQLQNLYFALTGEELTHE